MVYNNKELDSILNELLCSYNSLNNLVIDDIEVYKDTFSELNDIFYNLVSKYDDKFFEENSLFSSKHDKIVSIQEELLKKIS